MEGLGRDNYQIGAFRNYLLEYEYELEPWRPSPREIETAKIGVGLEEPLEKGMYLNFLDGDWATSVWVEAGALALQVEVPVRSLDSSWGGKFLVVGSSLPIEQRDDRKYWLQMDSIESIGLGEVEAANAFMLRLQPVTWSKYQLQSPAENAWMTAKSKLQPLPRVSDFSPAPRFRGGFTFSP